MVSHKPQPVHPSSIHTFFIAILSFCNLTMLFKNRLSVKLNCNEIYFKWQDLMLWDIIYYFRDEHEYANHLQTLPTIYM